MRVLSQDLLILYENIKSNPYASDISFSLLLQDETITSLKDFFELSIAVIKDDLN